jgi:hypothetical protein
MIDTPHYNDHKSCADSFNTSTWRHSAHYAPASDTTCNTCNTAISPFTADGTTYNTCLHAWCSTLRECVCARSQSLRRYAQRLACICWRHCGANESSLAWHGTGPGRMVAAKRVTALLVLGALVQRNAQNPQQRCLSHVNSTRLELCELCILLLGKLRICD